MPLAVDLTELDNATRVRMHELLTSEHAAQIVLAKQRQQQIAKFYHDNRPRAIEGMGGLEMAMDPFWIGYFNMKYGRQAMDKDFKQWLKKKEDWFTVKHTGTKLQVGYGTGLAGKRTFHKSYGDG